MRTNLLYNQKMKHHTTIPAKCKGINEILKKKLDIILAR